MYEVAVVAIVIVSALVFVPVCVADADVTCFNCRRAMFYMIAAASI